LWIGFNWVTIGPSCVFCEQDNKEHQVFTVVQRECGSYIYRIQSPRNRIHSNGNKSSVS